MQKLPSPNPLRGVSLSVRFRHFFYNHIGEISFSYLPRAINLFLVSILRVPFSLKEKVQYSRKIKSTIIQRDPIFILGHWRSGTTYLHNLFSQDLTWGYPTLFHTSFPQCFFSYEKIKSVLENKLPQTRPMDNMVVSFDLPQEEEFAIANSSRFSFYHGLTYPKHFQNYFDKYVLFEGLSEKEKKRWKNNYILFLKKVTLYWGGKPLVLKNPVNTARIKRILEIFPNAKFIHVHRQPIEVFYSTKKMLSALIGLMALHDISEKTLINHIIINYKKLMTAYLEQKKILPTSQLFELSYSDLINDPEKKIHDIYEHFNLPLSGLGNLTDYLSYQKSYQANIFNYKLKEIKLIKEQWGSIVKEFGYQINLKGGDL